MVENDASSFFFVYFLCSTAEKNIISKPLYPLHVRIFLPYVFGGVHGTALYRNNGSFSHCQIIVSHDFCEQKKRAG